MIIYNMGILLNDTIYTLQGLEIKKAYINISNEILIYKQGTSYLVKTHYNFYIRQDDILPFHTVKIECEINNLSLLYSKLYDRVKKDFISFEEVH